jgi:TusA-related sulfurtransferase
MLIHDTNVPGTDAMAKAKDRIRFVYVETPQGGRLDLITTDPMAVRAIHEFMRFQISDHKTGDTTAVTKR